MVPQRPPGRRPPRRTASRAVLLAALALPSGMGCQSAYLFRQTFGALRVLRGRVPIDEALEARLDPPERESLRWVSRIRDFARSDLGLDPGDAYTTYYDTEGRPISVIVVASHPLALIPYGWHFPFLGTVPYKGYLEPRQAAAERDRLRSEGWDATCFPVDAFSTLGWVSDPVLSSWLAYPPGRLADLLLHEITHRTVYFPGRSELNESLATAVAREGTGRLLLREFGADSTELREYLEGLRENDAREEVLGHLRDDLDSLYHSTLSEGDKRERKVELFATASRALEAAGMTADLHPSNAQVVLEREYQGLVPFFRRAISLLGGEPRELVEALKRLRGSPHPLADLQAEVLARRVRPPEAPESRKDAGVPEPVEP